MERILRCLVALVATVALAASASAQQAGVATGNDAATSGEAPATLAALQAAIDNKDSKAILNILNSTPKDQRGPLAALLLASAQQVASTDKQFAATLAGFAFLSGGLSTIQQNTALLIIRAAPGGLAIIANLQASAPTGGFGLTNVTTITGLFNLIATENQNQTAVSPN